MNRYTKKYSTQVTPEMFHIGSIIRKYINAKKISKSALARKIGRQPSTVLQFQKGATMQTGILLEISHALKHNFFMDVALLLPSTYSSDLIPDTSKDEKIDLLEKRIAQLEAQNEVLKEITKAN